MPLAKIQVCMLPAPLTHLAIEKVLSVAENDARRGDTAQRIQEGVQPFGWGGGSSH